MTILFTGDNTFAIRDAVNAQVRAAREKLGADAVTVADGGGLKLDDLPQLLLGATLFATERLVVLRDAAADKTVWDKLADLLPETPETTDILLIASTADKRTRTYKWLAANAEVRELALMNETQLTSWVQDEAKQRDMKIDAKTARYLVDYVGTDQWRLQQDLEKLRLSGQAPSIELIRQLIEPNPQASVFELLDAVFTGDQERTESSLQVIRGSEDPYRFFGLLAGQVYTLILVANAGSRDATAIAREAGVHPFVVRKLQPLARKLSVERQQAIVDTLADLDRQLKSTGADPWTLIHIALTTIAT